jgi:parallel beta-helix repeat protein
MVRSARLLGVSVAAALIASVLFIGPASAGNRGDTITVPKGGDIQGAINRADPGDTVLVGPGTYKGPVFITTDRVSLIGAGAKETWIVAPSAKAPFCGICVLGNVHKGQIVNAVSGVTVKGFTVKGFREFGIAGSGSMSLSVRNVHAANNGEYGITAFNSQGAQFFGNTTWGNGEAGFYIGDSPNSRAMVWNNTAYDSQFGFFFRDASFGTAENNTAWGNCAGFVVLNTGAPGPTKRWVIKNNVAHDNSRACSGGEGPPVSGIGVALVGTTRQEASTSGAGSSSRARRTTAARTRSGTSWRGTSSTTTRRTTSGTTDRARTTISRATAAPPAVLEGSAASRSRIDTRRRRACGPASFVFGVRCGGVINPA